MATGPQSLIAVRTGLLNCYAAEIARRCSPPIYRTSACFRFSAARRRSSTSCRVTASCRSSLSFIRRSARARDLACSSAL